MPDPQIYIVLIIGAFLASFLSSIAGSGGGFLIMFVFSLYFDIKETVILSTIFFFLNNTNKIALYHKTIDWNFCRWVLLGVLPMAVLGVLLFEKVDEFYISLLLVIVGIYYMSSHFISLPKIQKFTPLKVIIVGGFWGFISGLGNGAPIRVLLFKWRKLSKHVFVGTSGVLSICLDLIKLLMFYLLGLLSYAKILIVIPLFFISIIGNFLGKKALDKISHQTFEKIVFTLIAITTGRFLWMMIF